MKIVLADSSDNAKVYPQRPTAPKPAKAEETPVRDDPPAEDGKHWINDTTYVDDDGEVHSVEEETDGEDDEPATNPLLICPPTTPKRSPYSTNCLEMKSY